MFFSKTYTYVSKVRQEELVKRLVGKHLKIHNLDFEVVETDNELDIIAHTEEVEKITTLPVTHLKFEPKGDTTKVVVHYKVRELDEGGPQLLMIACTLMLLIAIVLYYVSKELVSPMIVGGLSLMILTIFRIRMEMGYYDYVRKIKAYLKSQITIS